MLTSVGLSSGDQDAVPRLVLRDQDEQISRRQLLKPSDTHLISSSPGIHARRILGLYRLTSSFAAFSFEAAFSSVISPKGQLEEVRGTQSQFVTNNPCSFPACFGWSAEHCSKTPDFNAVRENSLNSLLFRWLKRKFADFGQTSKIFRAQFSSSLFNSLLLE